MVANNQHYRNLQARVRRPLREVTLERDAHATLRDLAFVLKMTERVREEILAEREESTATA